MDCIRLFDRECIPLEGDVNDKFSDKNMTIRCCRLKFLDENRDASSEKY